MHGRADPAPGRNTKEPYRAANRKFRTVRFPKISGARYACERFDTKSARMNESADAAIQKRAAASKS